MRRVCRLDELRATGLTRARLRRQWRQVERGVYAEGRDEISRLDRALGAVVATGGAASGRVAGVLLGLDGVEIRGPDLTILPTANGRRAGVRRRRLPEDRLVLVEGVRCTNGLQTLIDLAAELSDVEWEWALESALRKRLTTVAELAAFARTRAKGADRARRVLALRPAGAPATGSLLETLMVQLAREVSGLPAPVRQHTVTNRYGEFVAHVDLCWPALGLFLELDGQQHADQPVYDARRETAVVAATGWLCGRITWDEVVRTPRTTARRLADLVDQARRRPMPQQ
jgi:hypothetical protein